MTSPGAELLGLLRADGVQGRAAVGPATGAAAETGFASLLERARAGAISSGREVTVSRGAEFRLSPDQLTRLSAAADRAEAAGAKKAVVLIDGQALQLDVLAREITGRAELKSGEVLTGVDAVLSAPEPAGTARESMFGAGRLTSNPSLLRVLEDRERVTSGVGQ